MAIGATVSIFALFNTKLGLVKRVAPMLISATLIGFYNKNIGEYGVHREIDDILQIMAGENNPEP